MPFGIAAFDYLAELCLDAIINNVKTKPAKHMKPLVTTALLSGVFFLQSCGNGRSSTSHTPDQKEESTLAKDDSMPVREEPVDYSAGGTTFKGYVYYNEAQQGKRPAVLVLPEWWGLTDYPRMRARKLAQLGYVAMAVDVFGEGKIADTPDEAQKLTAPFYTNAQLGKQRLDAALAKLKTFSVADTSQTAAIGYCFGGALVLNSAKLGSDLDGAVSFHGNLQGPPPAKGLKTKFLVCHGADDQFVKQQEVNAFKRQMDSAGVDYSFKIYPGATHAFTNPAATEKGEKFKMPIRYNGAADSASWNDMKAFFGRLFL